MKKTILSITLTLLSLLTMNAQNVKTKKNMAFLDNKPIATIIQDPVEKGDKTSRFERYYTVSDLQGNFLFKARLTKTTPRNNVHIEYWLELTNDQGTIFEYD
ncbi:MAG: hypothetical protein LBI72_08045 [Flavobacteriaceae bacterium]|jgi:hypothetical protein|nr:hypothetical protein [Flavobacteriaceae bacterium]